MVYRAVDRILIALSKSKSRIARMDAITNNHSIFFAGPARNPIVSLRDDAGSGRQFTCGPHTIKHSSVVDRWKSLGLQAKTKSREHMGQGTQARIALFAERPVQGFTRYAGFPRDLRHAARPRNGPKRVGNKRPITCPERFGNQLCLNLRRCQVIGGIKPCCLHHHSPSFALWRAEYPAIESLCFVAGIDTPIWKSRLFRDSQAHNNLDVLRSYAYIKL